MKFYDNAIKQFYDQKKEAVLAYMGDNLFVLQENPKSYMQSTFFQFYPQGPFQHIFIFGDHCPGNNRGVISHIGYGLGWFAKKQGPEYLAEKFLTEEWIPEVAQEKIKSQIPDYELKSPYLEWMREAAEDESNFESYGACSDVFDEHMQDCMEGICDYNVKDYALLAALQRRFVEEYNRISLKGK